MRVLSETHSATPWNAPYSASKAALHSYTDALDMELRPFSIRVLLLAPGMVRTNIVTNTVAKDTAPPADSLYTQYHAGIDASHARAGAMDAMSSEEFAKQTVSAALSARPPAYMSIAPMAWMGWFVGLIPRGPRLNLVWKMISG